MGIVNTVNNIRALHRPVGIPRQILARAALNASTLDEAIAVLTTLPRSGAFHHTLGQSGDSRLFSIEATGAGHSVRLLDGTFGHANHLIHESLRDVQQVITDSSASRQGSPYRRVNNVIATGCNGRPGYLIRSAGCGTADIPFIAAGSG